VEYTKEYTNDIGWMKICFGEGRIRHGVPLIHRA
jgi:hypothetical protein